MKPLAALDTTVLVAGLVAAHPNHAPCRQHLLAAAATPGAYRCAAHALAEAFRVLVALPLATRIDPAGAMLAIRTTLIPRLDPAPQSLRDYDRAMEVVCASGLGAGAVYDCLHLLSAERLEARFLVTANLRHLVPLAQAAGARVRVVGPAEVLGR
jgi:hypothetical protein